MKFFCEFGIRFDWMVIPTGTPKISKNNDLQDIETREKRNENQCAKIGSVSTNLPSEPIAQKKIAAPTVIGSSNSSSQHISANEQYQIEESDAMRTAALWYAANHANRSGASIPFIRETFGLTALEAIRVMQMGRKLAREARQ